MENFIQKNNKGGDWLSLLPADIKELLISPELSEKMVKVCIKYGLAEKTTKEGFITDPRTGKLVGIVIRILKGELPLKDFNETLGKELNINPTIVKEISTEIDQEIFSKIKTSLEKIPGIKVSGGKTVSLMSKDTVVLPPKTPRINKKSDVYRELIK